MSIFLQIALFILKLGMIFVPEQKYTQLISNIKTLEHKLDNFDLKGWTYKAITDSSTGFVHRYFEYPSQKENAKVLLFFHGLNLDGRTFMNLTELSKNYKIIAYDLPENTNRYKGNFQDFIDIVNEFISTINENIEAVGGVSFGGTIAMRLVASNPLLKDKPLILISTGMIGINKKERKKRNKMADWVEKQPDYKLYWFMEKLYSRSFHKKNKTSDNNVSKILRIKHPCFYRQVGLSMRDFNSVNDAKNITGDILWLLGDKDNLFSKEEKQNVFKYIPQVKFRVIKDGEHSMVYTKGKEISKEIMDFLSQKI